MKPFELNFEFDGEYLSVDYCDGSNTEYNHVTSQAELEAAVLEHVRTALSPEDD